MATAGSTSVGLATKYFALLAPKFASSQSVAIYGPAGVGKSLLLKELDGSSFSPYQFIVIDLKKRDSNTISSLYFLLLNELMYHFPEAASNHTFNNQATTIQLMSQIEAILEKIITADHQLVLLLDEFEEFIEGVDPLLFQNIRSLKDRFRRELHYVFIFHNPPTSLPQFAKNDSFLDLTGRSPIRLSPLTETEVTALLTSYPQFETLTKNKKIFNKIYELCGGHAGLLLDSARALIHQTKITLSQIKPIITENTAVNNRLERITINCLDSQELRYWSGIIPLLSDYIAKHEIPLPTINGKLENKSTCEFTYEARTNQIHRHNEPTSNLTAKELNLLKYFITNPKRVCGKDEIAEAVWIGENASGVSDEAIDKLVQRLRIKLETNPSNPQIIHTIRGRGYQFCE